MKLKDVILKEHSKRQCAKVVKYVGNNPARFSELVDVFLSGPYRVTQRAAWPISVAVEGHPALIRPHLARIVKFLQQPGVHDAVKRNVVRLLQFIKVPKSLQGRVASTCFQLLQNPHESVAVRVFSMTVLSNLARELPELKNELIPLIEDQMPFSTAGFISRGRRMLKALKA
ncbi:MAG TPA: hypothetical protein VKQ08_02055 [Cyclobacteriaceae bacterium]|nr:hypothetical protein [Cyclobacteriaceae bacterium]